MLSPLRKPIAMLTEPTGPEIHVYCDVGSQELCAVLRERVDLKRNDKISLAPRLDRVHLFDAAGGQAL